MKKPRQGTVIKPEKVTDSNDASHSKLGFVSASAEWIINTLNLYIYLALRLWHRLTKGLQIHANKMVITPLTSV